MVDFNQTPPESVKTELVGDGRPAPAAHPGDCCGLLSPTATTTPTSTATTTPTTSVAHTPTTAAGRELTPFVWIFVIQNYHSTQATLTRGQKAGHRGGHLPPGLGAQACAPLQVRVVFEQSGVLVMAPRSSAGKQSSKGCMLQTRSSTAVQLLTRKKAGTIEIALDGGARHFVRSPAEVCVEEGDFIAHWLTDTGRDGDDDDDESVAEPGWVDGRTTVRRGATHPNRWYINPWQRMREGATGEIL